MRYCANRLLDLSVLQLQRKQDRRCQRRHLTRNIPVLCKLGHVRSDPSRKGVPSGRFAR